MSDYDADVLIVGAGPAGALAARDLARRGASVRLIDASHPREKPCGGGLTERCGGDVRRHARPRARTSPIERVRFESPPVGRDPYPPAPRTPPSITVDVPRGGAGAASAPLRRRQPARVRRGARRRCAGSWRGPDSRARGGRRYDGRRGRRCPRGAAGGAAASSSAPTARTASSGGASTGRFPRRTGRWPPAPSRPARRAARSCAVRPQAPGYIWSFPRTDHLAIGICAPADRGGAPELRSHLDRWLAPLPLTRGLRLTPYSWPIPSLPLHAWADGVPVGDRWLLAGDAAGLVDPLTREGIYYALRSGELAAQALLGSGADPTRELRRAPSRPNSRPNWRSRRGRGARSSRRWSPACGST